MDAAERIKIAKIIDSRIYHFWRPLKDNNKIISEILQTIGGSGQN
jgi:hypothetical protein